MQFITNVAALLLAASATMASPNLRGQTSQTTADTTVRVILRDDNGFKEEVRFDQVDGRVSTGVSGAAFTTLEVDVGADVDPALRCAVTADDDVKIFATRGENLDDTFSDSTSGEWTFDGPTEITVARCDPSFVANNRNAA